MRPRLPGFGFAFSASIAILVTGCGAAGSSFKLAQPEAGSPAPPPPIPGLPATEAVADAAPAPVSAPVPTEPSLPPAADVATTPSTTTGAVVAPSREMLDIEANVSMQVPKVKHAVRALHELTTRLGGVVTAERVDTASEYAAAELTLRVPSAATRGVFDELDKLGSVLDQNVTARDIGKEYFDANLRLSSLETTLHRYEEILTHATKVEEILRIEQELSRVRTEIEQVKGNLRWLADRAARATLHITLHERVPEIAHSEEPDPKFYPGLRLPALLDLGKRDSQGYFGGGLSVRFSRAISLDLDLLKRPTSHERGPDAVLASIGGEIYSDLLDGAERRYLSPYLGWRAGYARFDHDNQALLGATLGLELYKSRVLGFDVEARNYLAFGGERGAHYLLSPALAACVAF
jgi:hypothetical protein